MPPVDRQQVIRERAYAIWEKEGHPDGKDLAHWLQAEHEVCLTEALLKDSQDAMLYQPAKRITHRNWLPMPDEGRFVTTDG